MNGYDPYPYGMYLVFIDPVYLQTPVEQDLLLSEIPTQQGGTFFNNPLVIIGIIILLFLLLK